MILPTPDSLATLERTLKAVARQSDAHELEIIVVAPQQIALDTAAIRHYRQHFAAFRVVVLSPFDSIGAAYATGVRDASADIVVLGEDHSFPDPGWSQALRRRHLESCAVVGPVVRNANPRTLTSRADFLTGYGRWMEPHGGGPEPFLPGHNSSYKRRVLLCRAERLDVLLQSETVLHWQLSTSSETLLIEPDARIAHTNYARLGVWLWVMFLNGRVFATNRTGHWPALKRLLYVCTSPAIPLIRAAHALNEIRRRPACWRHYGPACGVLTLGLLCDGVGQALGALSGRGRALERLTILETRRIDQITDEDRRELFER